MKPTQQKDQRSIPFPNLILPNLVPVNRPTRIRISVNNGTKEITVEENGKSIRVIENGDGIQVEKKDEKGRIVKTKYKDAAELKEKDADAHKAYQKAAPGGGVQIQMQQNGLPNLPGNGLPQFAPQQLQMQKQLDEIRKRLEEHRKRNTEMHQQNRKRHEEMLERIRKKHTVPPALPPQPKPIETETLDPIEVESSRPSTRPSR